MSLQGFNAADGSINVTVVSGSSVTGGVYAADGSINVAVSPGTGFIGAYAPNGAWYVTVAPTGITSIRAPDGSLYVSVSPYTNGGQRVTVVSGSLVPSGGAGKSMGLLLALTYAS